MSCIHLGLLETSALGEADCHHAISKLSRYPEVRPHGEMEMYGYSSDIPLSPPEVKMCE